MPPELRERWQAHPRLTGDKQGRFNTARAIAEPLEQLGAAALVWFFGGDMASIVSLSAGALLANVISVVILIVETTVQRR